MRTNSKLLLGGALALAAGALAAFAAPDQTGAQAQTAPVNTAPPTISDTTPEVGQTLFASVGSWTGDQPISFSFQWLRCNAAGEGCEDIELATGQAYIVQAPDGGNRLRVRVTARNARGSTPARSAATEQVPAPVGPVQIAAVVLPNRLDIDVVRFAPNRIPLSAREIRVTVRVRERSGRAVQGALVFVRSTPLVTSSAREVATDHDGIATVRLVPRRNFSIIRFQDNLQFFVRARKAGEDLQGGVSSRRLVQVRIG